MSGAPNLHALIQLQQALLSVTDKRTLAFNIVNDTRKLVQYEQAILFTQDNLLRLKLTAISGQISTIEDTPFTQWLKRLQRQVINNIDSVTELTCAAIPDPLQSGWREWWHQFTLVIPLEHQGVKLGYLMLNREQSFSETEIKSLGLLNSHMGYTLAHLSRRQYRKRTLLTKKRFFTGLTAVAVAGLLTIPIPLSVTVNAEVISQHTAVVAAPLDGVIAKLHVAPNTLVTQGDLLFEIDDTVLRNELNIARQELVVAQVEAHTMQQRAFSDMDSKAELASLRGKIKEKQAQIELISEQLQRTKVYADFAGYAIYNDEDDWLGVPVRTGERIIKLAAPEPIAVQGWIPVADVISLQQDAPFKLYLRSEPLITYEGQMTRHSFQPEISPDGIAAYTFEGHFSNTSKNTLEAADNGHSAMAIGARGVATLYGEKVSLAYFLLRRPIGVLRQWVGW